MMELRKDYILNRWVIISEARGKRPHELKESEKIKKNRRCVFCPENISLTPGEKGRFPKDADRWSVRWIENKFPAVMLHDDPLVRTADEFFTYSKSYGVHEIIIESYDHDEQLWDKDNKKLKTLLKIYTERIKELSSIKDIKYAALFKNHGLKAGTSVIHSHTQVIAMNIIPPSVEEEIEKSSKDGCAYCRIIQKEKDSLRRAFENDSFTAFTPYASRFNYEIWLFSKRHIGNIDNLSEKEYDDLAEIFGSVLVKIKELGSDYNLYIHHSPKGKDLHWHIEFCPRIARWGGFEIGTGVYINAVPPEKAAAFYRGEILDIR